MALGKVLGVYRLSKDIELRYLPSGQSLAKIGLVNSSKYKTQSGEQKEESCFIDGSIFGKMAEIANQYLHKGSKIFVDAELKQESWEKDGQKFSKHTLKINSFEMLDSKQDNQGQSNQQPKQQDTYQPQEIPEVNIDEDEFSEQILF